MIQRVRVAAAALVLALGIGTTPAKAEPPSAAVILGAAAAAVFLSGEIAQTPQPDAGRAMVGFGAGYFDVYERDRSAAAFSLEYRPGWQLWRFKPMIGTFVTTDGAVAAYIGAGYDLHIGKHFVANINVAPAFYAAGGGKHLGSFAVLRSGVEVGYRFNDGSRLVASFHHYSHGGAFGSRNPGTDIAALNLYIPVETLDKLFD